MNNSIISKLAGLALGCASFALLAADETAQPLWQIGRSDRGYGELAIARNYPAFAERFGRQPVVFEVGRSEAARDWPFIHPGPVDAWAGNREHPMAIRFQLTEPPRGLFRLRLEFVDAHGGSPPILVLRAGGRTGRFPLQPGGGDASLVNPEAGRPQTIEAALPASLFRAGTNELVLSTIDGAWALYDAISFWNDREVNTTEPEIQEVAVEATPFYPREQGRVRRLLQVRVKSAAPAENLVIRVEAGGETSETKVRELAGLGTMSQEVSVTCAGEAKEATITAIAGARRKSTTIQLTPGKKWKLFVAASAHTDIGYTDLQPKCAERHNENTDRALDLLAKYPDFKWNLEVAWQAENYLTTRTDARREQFLRFAREGRLGVQALYNNILSALCSHESACRLTAYAHQLKTRQGIPFRSAMISDVPTQEAFLPMVLANAGIRYFSSGINNDRAYTFTELQSKCPCWWEGPDGSRVLMMYAPQYAQASQWGLTRSVAAARAAIGRQLKNYERPNYPYDAIWLHGAIGDNDVIPAKLAEVAHDWNEQFESPRLVLSHNAEFFEYIERQYGDRLPVVRGSAGSYWEDGAGSSARETALCRQAKESLAQAETFLALTRQLQPGVGSYPSAELERAWRNCLLYDEHTWGAHCSISQPDSEFSKQQWAIKAQFAVDAEREAASLLARGNAALAAQVRTDQRSLVVINSASWPRTEVVQVRLPAGLGIADAPACDVAGSTLLLAKDVPACGYRTFPLEPKAGRATAEAAAGAVLESRYYRITFDPANGAITQLLDKELNRELVDSQAPYRLNEYLYVAGGNGTRIVMNPHGPEPKLEISRPAKAGLRRLRLGDLGERMVIESSAAMAPRLVTEVTVWNHLRRVDLVNRFDKTQTYDKEAVYFSFPFAARQPVFRYQCPAGIVNANTDMLPGACLDWFAVQHFVEIESGDAAIAWATPDAPLVCFQDINRGRWQRSLPMKNGHLYAYVMNNYWHTNYKPGQGGEHAFRFSITSRAKADHTASTRFGWAAANPLQTVPAERNPGGSLPGPAASLVEIAEPNVLLLGAKRAEAGDGLVLRLWEASGRPTTAHVRVRHSPVTKAAACTLVEEAQGTLAVKEGVIEAPMRGNGLLTVRVE